MGEPDDREEAGAPPASTPAVPGVAATPGPAGPAPPAKPTQSFCRRALEEALPEVLHDQVYSDATVDFLNSKIVQALTVKFRGMC